MVGPLISMSRGSASAGNQGVAAVVVAAAAAAGGDGADGEPQGGGGGKGVPMVTCKLCRMNHIIGG